MPEVKLTAKVDMTEVDEAIKKRTDLLSFYRKHQRLPIRFLGSLDYASNFPKLIPIIWS